MVFNPYTHQTYLFVDDSERAALGQFMSQNAQELEWFFAGEDAEMVAVSTDGNGPPDGWCFASYVTEAQSNAFISQSANFPASTEIQTHALGTGPTFDTWLLGIGYRRILDV